MEVKAQPDFSGYATKAGLRCSDGRLITPDAFKHQDGVRVPLVWQHNHDNPDNVLGHVILTHVSDGMRAEAYFNSTPRATNAKILVEHKDLESLSIYANQLVEKAKSVLHGMIREVSLVLAGANPGALIDNITIAHSDGMEVLDDEAIIYTGLTIQHSDQSDSEDEPLAGSSAEDVSDKDASAEDKNNDDSSGKESNDEDLTVQHVYDTLDDSQKELVHYMVGAAVEKTKNDSSNNSDDNQDQEGTSMESAVKHNVFEDADKDKDHVAGTALTHSEMKDLMQRAIQLGSLREAVKDHALKHGINDIEVLFPNAVNVTDTPEFNSRRIEWVAGVLNAVLHSPFSRIKSLVADLTFEDARAKGYIKGELKKEEWFSVSRRVTTPATVYKKQKLDRDDILDITDFDVVIWLKAEMRLMFDEELARAILIGDGRDVDDPDKIKDPAGAPEGAGIRSILHDHDLYAPTVTVDDSATSVQIVDAITTGMSLYKGSGAPVFYTTLPVLTNLLLARDQFDHRLWKNAGELASEMGLSGIVTVEVMEDETDLLGIIVNLRDYRIGADKGGEINFFDFFDIDYNQYKYLYESRLSGALTKIRSAVVVKRAAAGGTLATPTEPGFTGTVVTVPTTTGVVYKNKTTGATLTTGAPVTLASGASLTVEATPASGYYFSDNVHDEWTFTNES
jgi:hypothetical protein